MADGSEPGRGLGPDEEENNYVCKLGRTWVGSSSLGVERAVRGLKIDGAFVAGLPGDEDDAAIARAIIVPGRVLGLQVAAEGIETRAQAESLKAAGCRISQGYLFSRPLAAAEFGAYCRPG